MKFVVSSTELLSHLSAISKVISSKSTMPILDNFLFQLTETELTITASDLESTLITSLELDNIEGEGSIAVPAKLLTDTLKEFPEQPLTFQIRITSYNVCYTKLLRCLLTIASPKKVMNNHVFKSTAKHIEIELDNA